MELVSYQLAREHQRTLRAEAERAHVVRTVRVAQRLERRARRAALRASQAHEDLQALQV